MSKHLDNLLIDNLFQYHTTTTTTTNITNITATVSGDNINVNWHLPSSTPSNSPSITNIYVVASYIININGQTGYWNITSGLLGLDSTTYTFTNVTPSQYKIYVSYVYPYDSDDQVVYVQFDPTDPVLVIVHPEQSST